MADQASVDEVFKTKVKERLELHANQWTGKDSAVVNQAIVTSRHDKDDKPIELSQFEKDVIQLASQPTFEVQVRVIRSVIEAHGGKVDVDTDKRIRQVVNPTMFKATLIKAGKIKGDDDSGLKDLLG